MKLFQKVLLIAVVLPFFSFTMHKYYVSLCEVEYLPEREVMQISLGLFIDDIELTLNKDYGKTLKLATPQEAENIDEMYLKYLNEHFRLVLNGTATPYTYIGKEYDDDIVRFYLEVPNLSELNSFEVYNRCLLRDFDDQLNIIKLKVKNYHKTFYLSKKNDKGLLKF